MLLLSLISESNEGGNNCRPIDEHEAISGNRTCHFARTNSPFKTAAFAPGQLLDLGQVGNRSFFSVKLPLRLILTKFDNVLTSANKTPINEGWGG